MINMTGMNIYLSSYILEDMLVVICIEGVVLAQSQM